MAIVFLFVFLLNLYLMYSRVVFIDIVFVFGGFFVVVIVFLFYLFIYFFKHPACYLHC